MLPALSGCEEIARRRVGVTLSEKGPNCSPQLSGNVESCQGCGRSALRPYSLVLLSNASGCSCCHLVHDRPGRRAPVVAHQGAGGGQVEQYILPIELTFQRCH